MMFLACTSYNDCQISVVKDYRQNIMIVLEGELEQFVICRFDKFNQIR